MGRFLFPLASFLQGSLRIINIVPCIIWLNEYNVSRDEIYNVRKAIYRSGYNLLLQQTINRLNDKTTPYIASIARFDGVRLLHSLLCI